MLQTSTGNLVNSVLKTEFFKGEALYQEGIRGTGEGGATLILSPARGNVDEQGSFPKYQYLALSSDPTWNGSAVNSVLLSCVSSTPVFLAGRLRKAAQLVSPSQRWCSQSQNRGARVRRRQPCHRRPCKADGLARLGPGAQLLGRGISGARVSGNGAWSQCRPEVRAAPQGHRGLSPHGSYSLPGSPAATCTGQ